MSKTLKSAYSLIEEPADKKELSEEYFFNMLYYISTHILKERLKKKMTQTEFGKLLEVSQAMVSKLESGEYNFSLKEICDISAKLNIKPDFSFINKTSEQKVYHPNINIEANNNIEMEGFCNNEIIA